MCEDKTQFAKKLRKESTNVEIILWHFLKAHRFLGLKFKRQQPIGNYIVDFVCFSKQLIIELDGGQHALRKTYDKHRDNWFKSQGYKILRFWNNEVIENIEAVLVKIAMHCTSSELPLPNPLPPREWGIS